MSIRNPKTAVIDYAAIVAGGGPIINLVRSMAHDMKIVVISREAADTARDWLDDHVVPYDEMHMLCINKSDALHNLIMRDHQITLAIESDPESVAMWRANGVHCLQAVG